MPEAGFRLVWRGLGGRAQFHKIRLRAQFHKIRLTHRAIGVLVMMPVRFIPVASVVLAIPAILLSYV